MSNTIYTLDELRAVIDEVLAFAKAHIGKLLGDEGWKELDRLDAKAWPLFEYFGLTAPEVPFSDHITDRRGRMKFPMRDCDAPKAYEVSWIKVIEDSAEWFQGMMRLKATVKPTPEAERRHAQEAKENAAREKLAELDSRLVENACEFRTWLNDAKAFVCSLPDKSKDGTERLDTYNSPQLRQVAGRLHDLANEHTPAAATCCTLPGRPKHFTKAEVLGNLRLQTEACASAVWLDDRPGNALAMPHSEGTMPSVDTKPQSAPPCQSHIDLAKQRVPITLEDMAHNDQDCAEQLAPGEKVVRHRQLTEELRAKGHTRDAAEWAIHQLVQDKKLKAHPRLLGIPLTGTSSIPVGSDRSYNLNDCYIESTPALRTAIGSDSADPVLALDRCLRKVCESEIADLIGRDPPHPLLTTNRRQQHRVEGERLSAEASKYAVHQLGIPLTAEWEPRLRKLSNAIMVVMNSVEGRPWRGYNVEESLDAHQELLRRVEACHAASMDLMRLAHVYGAPDSRPVRERQVPPTWEELIRQLKDQLADLPPDVGPDANGGGRGEEADGEAAGEVGRSSTAQETEDAESQALALDLNATEAAVLKIIKKQRKGKGIQGKKIISALATHGIEIADGYLRRHIIPKLKKHFGVVSHPSAGGYLIPR